MGAIGFINAFASCRLFQKTIFACVEITLLRMMHQSTIGAHPPAQPPGISQLPGEGPNMSVKRVGGTQERRKMPHPMYGPPFVKKSDLRNSPAIRKKKKKSDLRNSSELPNHHEVRHCYYNNMHPGIHPENNTADTAQYRYCIKNACPW